MKKLALNKITAGIALLMTCQVAFATSTTADVGGGTITFYGAVTDATCNVTTNSGSDFAVDLNPVTSTDMGTTVGVVSTNAKQFTLNVDGCSGFDSTSATAQTLKITFSGGNVSDDNTYLKNTTGTSSGVGIGITKDGSQLVALNSALDSGLKTTSSDGTNFDTAPGGAINYYANYYNYGGAAVKAGSVVTTATYTFTYE
ncbi:MULTISPECIES: fimbrial protein [Pantoea]|uniref:Type 1 fimbrial protein n=1 Tax=Candidatus Pantoea gossypiicola TaxID=2608008 RepID=A0AB34CP65_9GAMM|nr:MULTISPECIES: fimbrial protein [Pantoea]KAA5933671.1 type 1 fimbrial protein [Pantoea sp. VH_8]KAA5938262.1 type 1 fimbrial protein [Pantoea sp. VH_4]KAA5990190.1 type 1 fimbrial protein [Pantoea sp. M_4]KAA6128961.1 type 1 fimbrial protein [Pantoea gossypiicola]